MRKYLAIAIKDTTSPTFSNTVPETDFETIYRNHYHYVYKLALNHTRCKESAEDIVQEIFLKLLHRGNDCCKIQSIRHFLITLVYHQCVSQHRKQLCHRKHLQHLLITQEDTRRLTEEMIDDHELNRITQEAISRLSPQRKKVFMLGKIEGRKRAEIARLLGIAEDTVKENLRMANRLVQEYVHQRTGICKKAKLLLYTPRKASRIPGQKHSRVGSARLPSE